jgi:hypothetical protein
MSQSSAYEDMRHLNPNGSCLSCPSSHEYQHGTMAYPHFILGIDEVLSGMEMLLTWLTSNN